MNKKIRSQDDLPDQKFTTRSESDSVNTGAKETLKSIKIYIPAEGYDSKMSLEQNLAEGRVKLFSEMPASDFDMNSDPIQECLNFPNIQKQHSNSRLSSDLGQQNLSGIASPKNSDFDKLTDCYPQKTASHHSFLNSTVQQNVTPRESEKLHSCDVCYKSFSRRRDLALHYLTHSEKEKRRGAKAMKKCEICGNNPLQCRCKSVVEKIYPNYTNLPSSISIPKPLSSSTVFVKAESTSGKSSLIKRELYHCPECDQTFGLEMQRKQHVLVHKREKARREKEQKSVCCDFCDEKFSDKSNLASHVSTSHPEYLKLVSSQNNSDESQIILPNVLEPQVCTSCHTIFNNVDGLQKHLKRLGWVCNVCSTYFCLKSDFKAHYLTHFDGTPCENFRSSNLNRLSLPINDSKKFESEFLSCNICNKSFKLRCLLTQHFQCHALQKNYFCKLCKRKFKQKRSAYVHYFSHRKDKSNVCQICDKHFFLRKCLEIHNKTHMRD